MEGITEFHHKLERGVSLGSTYFDTLPSEIFQTILKYVLISLPNTSTQEEENDAISKKRERILTISMLFSRNGPFHDSVSTMFTNICLDCCAPGPNSSNDNSFEVGLEIFESAALEHGLPEQIFQLCGESIKTMLFPTYWNRLPPVFVQRFVSLVSIYCPNVENLWFGSLLIDDTSLPFDAFAPTIVQQFSTRLRSFKLSVHVSFYDSYYLHLPAINMCSHIRELEFPASPHLISFLRTAGASLESLDVRFKEVDGCAEMIDTIERHCTKLRTIYLRDCSKIIEKVGEERYASFLCSFESRLSEAPVHELSVAKLAQVVGACSNLLVRSWFVGDRRVDEWERVSLVGSMISLLIVDANACRHEQCEEAIAKCTRLEELVINPSLAADQGIVEVLELNFLSSLSSSITKFEHWSFTATQKNIAMVAIAPWNLREMFLYPVKSIDTDTDFKVIVDSNPQLESVSLWESNHRNDERGKEFMLTVLRMLVKTFSKCRAISFKLWNREEQSIIRDEIHDICGLLPCRGVDVCIEVGSTQYQQTK